MTMSRIAARFRQAFDLGIVTTTMICLSLVVTYSVDEFTTTDLRTPFMFLDLICVIALLGWQFNRIRQRRQDDELLKAIIDAVPHILFFKDTHFQYRQVNAMFEKSNDVSAKRALGLSDRELFGDELGQRFRSQDEELLSSGQMRTFDQEMLIHGERRYIQATKRPVYGQSGLALGIVGIATDVTDQRRLQQELRDAHARLDVALHAAKMGVWEWDLETDRIYVDATTRALLRIDLQGDQVAAAVFARMHPDDAERIRKLLESVRLGQPPIEYEFRVIDDNGKEHWVEGFASSNSAPGKHHCLTGINRDVTELRRSKQALTEAKNQAEQALGALERSRIELDMALSAGGLGVWHSTTTMARSGSIIQQAFLAAAFSADDTVLVALGLPLGAHLTYRDFIQAIHPDDRDRAVATLEGIHGYGVHVYHDQYRLMRPGGEVRTLDVRGSITRQPIGFAQLLVSITGVIKDVTDEEALKADLSMKAEEARLAKDAKSRFLAMVSHEVRTPMNGVLGMLDLLLDTPLTADQSHMLLRCKQSSQALLTIVNDILDFSKIEAGKLEIESTSLSLRSLIEDICADFSHLADRKHLKLGTHIDTDIPQFVLGDPVRLRQILTNLLSNAIKFTATGQVKVSARVWGGDHWALEVQDSGPGLSTPLLAQLFQPFQQADVSTTRRYGGTGLGLSIVKQLAELMDGTIDCQSELGHGSCFRVVLPLRPWVPAILPAADGELHDSDTPHAQTVDASNPLASPLVHRRLLLAEDNPINQEVILWQLDKLGYIGECAEDGEQAWSMLQAPGAAYDALLTDINMPRLDGYALTERIRAWEQRYGSPHLPILAMTANALRGERERCLGHGMDGYLSKPLQTGQLQEALDRLFTGGAPSAAQSSALPRTVTTKDNQTEAYAGVRIICRNDPLRLRNVLQLFVTSVSSDAESLEHAYHSRNADQMRFLAHKIGSGCQQLDESDAKQALLLIEDAINLEQMLKAYPAAAEALHAALNRASVFLNRQTAEKPI